MQGLRSALLHPPLTDAAAPLLAQSAQPGGMRLRHGVVSAASATRSIAPRRSASARPPARSSFAWNQRMIAGCVADLYSPTPTVLLLYFEGRSSRTSRACRPPRGDGAWRQDPHDAALGARRRAPVDRKKAARAAALALTAPRPRGGGGGGVGWWPGCEKMPTRVAAWPRAVLLAARCWSSARRTLAHRDDQRARAGVAAAPRAPTSESAPRGHRRPTAPVLDPRAARACSTAALETAPSPGGQWSTGEGVANAQVTFASDDGATIAAGTDAAGRFALEPPAAGRYVLALATAQGFLPYAPEWGHGPVAVVARPGLRITDVTLFLIPAVEYTGLVVDAKGHPVAGATARSSRPPRREP